MASILKGLITFRLIYVYFHAKPLLNNLSLLVFFLVFLQKLHMKFINFICWVSQAAAHTEP